MINNIKGNTTAPEMAHFPGFFFQKKLSQVGFELTSLFSLDQCSVHPATEAAQWLWVELGNTKQGKCLYCMYSNYTY